MFNGNTEFFIIVVITLELFGVIATLGYTEVVNFELPIVPGVSISTIDFPDCKLIGLLNVYIICPPITTFPTTVATKSVFWKLIVSLVVWLVIELNGLQSDNRLLITSADVLVPLLKLYFLTSSGVSSS